MHQTKDILQPSGYFPSVVYTVEKPAFLVDVIAVAERLLEKSRATAPLSDVYPMYMTESLLPEARAQQLAQFIAESAWAVLDNQGYNMDGLETYVNEIWVQEHHKGSGMEQHVHSHGTLLSGFYFLQCPENSSMIELHDPRPGKVQSSLPLKDAQQVRDGHNSIFIPPKDGLFVLTNSWLPHSFTRNTSTTPFRFVHFNVSVRKSAPVAQAQGPIVV